VAQGGENIGFGGAGDSDLCIWVAFVAEVLMRLLILRWTHRIWQKEIWRILELAYQKRVIGSKELKILEGWFDADGEHLVY